MGPTTYREAVAAYQPQSLREQADRELILYAMDAFPQSILTRENLLCHMTASAFPVNPARTAVLMAYHNIYQSWAWPGGHADGSDDPLADALRETWEELGVHARPLSPRPASVEVLPVPAHEKRGRPVAAHLHLNVSFLLEVPEDAPLRGAPEENSGVAWIPLARLEEARSEPDMLPIYRRLAERAR